jgi:hypothetical protein
MTNSNNIKTLCIPHGKERTNELRKDEENVLINTKKNNAAYYFEKFNIPSVSAIFMMSPVIR